MEELFYLYLRISGIAQAEDELQRFLVDFSEGHFVQIRRQQSEHYQAEAVIAISWADKEQVRIDWNIRIAELEEKYPEALATLDCVLESRV